jgi:gliding motility-associated lipoprotein GldH
MNSYKTLVAFFLGLLLLTACSDDRLVYEKIYSLPGGKWYADSVLRFELPIAQAGKYDVYYHIRNTLDYPYYNMYVQYTLIDSTGKVLAKHLQHIELMDPKTGEPYGTNLGDIFEHELIALPVYEFPAPGKYIYLIQQYMREDPLPEVLSFGVKLRRYEDGVPAKP